MQNFKHRFPIQIRFKDIDRMGHVNNAVYLTFIETARVHYFDSVVGHGNKWSHSVGLILARTEIDYKAPVFLRDTISVLTRCARIGTKSITIEWVMVRENSPTEEVVAQGISVLVCYDYDKNATIAVPDEHRRLLEAYEKQ
ncbi:MAG: acyl-CoA thioesterase [Cyclobacteriaceae bacterium]|jgi:acyl-CoA thioester hydrolase|nr:acyl-CoA thioesterase [Cyclobacteriaceae bacterium]